MVDRSRPNPARRPGIAPRAAQTTGEAQDTMTNSNQRECPWCGSNNTSFFKRGLTGPTDERDQYITCHDCGRLTYEIVSRTRRIEGRGGNTNSFCAWYSFKMSFWSVPPSRWRGVPAFSA